MFGAIGRWFTALGYLMTGQIDAARRTLDTNPHVVRAKYDQIINEKMARIQQYKQAVAQLMAQQEKKAAKARDLTKDVTHLENLKAGALAKAKQRVAALGDVPKEQIQADEDYKKCLGAFNDFSSTLAEKQDRIAELENDINEYDGRVKDHKVQLQHLVREIESVKSEAADAVADFITAKQEKEINDALTGIATDGTDKELAQMRDLRTEVKAEAKISKELAGSDTRAQEAEFLEYARTNAANDEFDALIGLADNASPAPQAAEKDSALPE